MAAAPLGVMQLNLYLADFERVVLQPILLSPDLTDPIVAEEDVANSAAGRAFRTARPVVERSGEAVQVWVPLVERAERTGVLGMTLPALDDALLADCVRLGRFAGILVRGFARTTDLVHLRRRRRTMTLAAGMQWDLLPPLSVRCSQAMACGLLEPAYEIAGDAFDYALNDRQLDAALFDGMGHGVGATLLTTLAIGAYRHVRRGGEAPAAAHAQVDEAVATHFGEEAFVTGTLIRLSLETGLLEWTNAGHPAPLLLRANRVIAELDCPPSLPFGLGGEPQPPATEALLPGDSVLFYTDGVVEGRSHTGEEFGIDRLARSWQAAASTGLPPEENLRQLADAFIAFNAGKLRDDATLLLIHWSGPARGEGPRKDRAT